MFVLQRSDFLYHSYGALPPSPLDDLTQQITVLQERAVAPIRGCGHIIGLSDYASTLSIFHKKTAERFIRALEESAAHPGCEVHSDMKVSYANADEVRKMFKKD